MGFSPLEGLLMGTRPGDLDPGVVLHLLRKGMTLEEVERQLNHDSGLMGLAGTNDMQELLSRSDSAARFAVELFCYRARKYVGAYLAVLQGAEAVVFTGGLGNGSPEIRRRICETLAVGRPGP
jgi:acetate kinase